MNRELLSMLVCPRCCGSLMFDRKRGELVCETDRLAFPVRNGVPVLLEMDARQLDTGEGKTRG